MLSMDVFFLCGGGVVATEIHRQDVDTVIWTPAFPSSRPLLSCAELHISFQIDKAVVI